MLAWSKLIELFGFFLEGVFSLPYNSIVFSGGASYGS